MNVRYALAEQEVSPDKFRWVAPDGTVLAITKETIAHNIEEGGKEYAVSQIYSALNLAFSNNIVSGNSYIEIADDGTPVDFYQESGE